MNVQNSGLIKWLTNKVLGEVTEDGEATFIELWHNQSGEEGERISRAQIPEEADAEEIAEEILELAQRDAQTRISGLPERYNVRYFIGTNDQHEGYYPFVISSSPPSKFTGDPTDPPTEKGLTAQLMRHLEASQRMVAQVVEVTTGRLIRDLETERAARQALEASRLDVARMREELLDRRFEREREQAAAIASMGHKQQVLQSAAQVLPVLLTNLLPKANIPNGQSELSALKSFATGLSPSEISGIMSSLEPKNQQLLAQLLASLQNTQQESEGRKE